MGVTRDLAPVLIRQFLHSYWSRATAETVVPHHAIRATRTAFPYKELFTREIILTIIIFAFCFTFCPNSDDVFDLKGIYEWESKCVESVFN